MTRTLFIGALVDRLSYPPTQATLAQIDRARSRAIASLPDHRLVADEPLDEGILRRLTLEPRYAGEDR